VKRIAVLHDRFMGFGGGENVAVEIAKTLNAPLYTSYKDTDHYDNSGVEIIPFKQDKYVNSWYKSLIRREAIETALIAFDFEELDLSEYNLIFSSAVLSRSYIPTIDQYVINYMHSPPRWLYDLHRVRMKMLSKPARFFARFWAQWWRTWDVTTLNYIDQFVCNSKIIQKRIKRYWGRDSIVICPPVYTRKFTNKNDEGYYLSINRLIPEKRIDLIIDAFKHTGAHIKFIGAGMDKRYKKMARGHNNIEFLGEVSEKEKTDLLAHCRAAIYIPMHEDFGIVPIESFASGKPVIGINEGYTPYQVNESNGILIDQPTELELTKAIEKIEDKDWNVKTIQESAKKYDVSEFRRKIKNLISEVR